ncbi:MAG TPA: hypothetical protein VJ866_15495 [Pyrinomonadaceae bacterium]|nr:hypothetical protein [Pyrinomonadaceae bacterium]
MRTNARHTGLVALAAVLLALCAAREASAQAETAEEQGPPRARKIDEFGRLYGCAGGAHLDNLAIELQKEPDSVAYIMAYDAPARAPLTAHFWGEYLRRYLIEYRGIEESRVRLVEAGRRAGDDLSMEFWVVPPGAEPPAARPAKEKKGAARPFAGKFTEYFAFDGAQFYDTDGGEPGDFHIGITFDAFRELLRRQPESQGYVVVYASRGAYPGYWRNVATREREKLTADGVGAERLTVLRGGVNEGRVKGFQHDEDADDAEQFDRVELWVGEKEKPPVRERPEKATLKGAALVASVDSYSAGEEEINRWALDNLDTLLRANAHSTAYVVVYPDGEPTPQSDGEGKETPPPDLFKRAEALKAELRGRGVDEARLVILSGPAKDYGARIELWAVPYGAAPPNPSAGEEQAEEPEGQETPAPEQEE